ncbi:hypothetical protein SAMN06264346_101511 [Chryseobacterium profundimaris]|uniref:Uncharacterized protein n=1 Tax=Chryseobacterium profundimaris TaxID=1387275 RepID=A0ABY1NCL4_9FLAO|nr:hypothetical protein SAMN06264346_101511 [Chryseobacterium profundimaris]
MYLEYCGIFSITLIFIVKIFKKLEIVLFRFILKKTGFIMNGDLRLKLKNSPEMPESLN